MRGLISISQILILICVIVFLFGDFFSLKKWFKKNGFKKMVRVFKKIESFKNRKKGN